MTYIKVGDEVRILKHSTRYSSFPEGGYAGTVTKVARKYATATYVRQRTAYPAGPVEETVEFDMATGKPRDEGRHYGIYVRTAERYEQDKRQSAATVALREHGIQLDFARRKFTLEQIEALAEVVKTFDTEGA